MDRGKIYLALTPRARPNGSEREAAHAAVDVDHLAGDVAGQRRGEERDQARHVLGLAQVADRDVGLDEGLAFDGVGVNLFEDLLALDAPRRQAVDGDAVRRQHPRQALRPGVHRGLRRRRDIDGFRLAGPGDVDDAPPLLFPHFRDELQRQPPQRLEIKGHAFMPRIVGRIPGDRPRPAGAIDEDVETAQGIVDPITDSLWRALFGDVLVDDLGPCRAGLGDLIGQFVQQGLAPSQDGDAASLGGHYFCCPFSNPLASAGDETGAIVEL